MKRIYLFIAAAILLIFSNAWADEGMWLLPLIQELNIKQMQDMGLQLTADQIYSINNTSLKDAVGALDYGSCTAELISPDGLILTNHHCGFDEIQHHSSVEHDYLKNGFWAMSRDEELPNPGKTISFIIRMESVTDRINAELNPEMDDAERNQKILEVTEQIKTEAVGETHYEARVESLFGGNEFYLVILETFLDIRLVGAPPENIGKFGHDTDNWVWPRHTGDFSMFRIYTAPDGKPAEYSSENIPLKSKYFFPISLKGVEKDDFTMVLGFPGITNRYLTSWEIEEILQIDNPNRVKIRGLRQQLMMEDMLSNDEIRIKYASKYSNSSNYWKYSIGQNQGINKLGLIERKRNQEKEFQKWIDEDKNRKEKYGDALEIIRTSINARRDYHHARQYLIEAMVGGVEFINFSISFFQLFIAIVDNPEDKQKIDEVIASMKESIDNYFKDYNASTDKKISVAMLQLLADNVKAEYHPDFFAQINNKYKGNYQKFMDNLFKKSLFVDRSRLDRFLESPDLGKLQKDPAFIIAMSVYRKYFEIDDLYQEAQSQLSKGQRLYIAGLMEMWKDRTLYPDANSTIRLTYGKVGDYQPRDAVVYDYFTTLLGVMEKEDPDNYEFVVDPKLKELFFTKDYGRYAHDGDLVVCFTTNNDITGGNSGSPVLNGKGELIGIAFDGNWEAMSGDLAYESALQKCINVDIRYVLFIIDKFAGAKHLIEEMMIVE